MNRRDFLRSGLATAGLFGSNAGFAAGLDVVSNFVTGSKSVGDYKTLVCVFLQGGADSISLFVPTSSGNYESYKKIRQNLTYEQDSLNPLYSWNYDIGEVGFPSFIKSFSDLFNSQKLAVVSNVGPLREPTTLSMIQSNKNILPPYMNSHSDHQNLWQTGFVSFGEKTGWGGRVIEAFNNTGAKVPNNISLMHTRKFLRGRNSNPFVVSTEETKNLSRYVRWEDNTDTPLREIFKKLTHSQSSSLDRNFTKIVNSTMDNNQSLQNSLEDASNVSVSYPTVENSGENALDGGSIERFTSQLKRAADLIEIAPTLGHHRQVIYVDLNGFDTHDNQATKFPQIMQLLSDGMKAFQSDLESRGVDDRVVTFTQSEFGRTITINSNGTDHGWGGHQFVMGTPVQGGQVIGALPEYAIGSSDIYQSSFIPQYSVEQYAANLSKWFGISDSEMSGIFPTYNRFENIDFGLFN